MSKRDQDGVSLRETTATVERMTGRMPEEGINPEESPDLLHDLWRMFLDLNASRGGGMGPAPITYPDLHAYCQLHQLHLEGWELAALRHLDHIALSGTNETKK